MMTVVWRTVEVFFRVLSELSLFGLNGVAGGGSCETCRDVVIVFIRAVVGQSVQDVHPLFFIFLPG